MDFSLGPRATRLLNAWGKTAAAERTGVGYDLTTPTRSDRYRTRLNAFLDTPTEETFEDLWRTDTVADANQWFAAPVRQLWSGDLDDLASFFRTIRDAESYNDEWRRRAPWGAVTAELYTRDDPGTPIVTEQSKIALRKLGLNPESGYEARRDQLRAFRDLYLDAAGHVTADSPDQIPVYEEIDQFFEVVTTVSQAARRREEDGPRAALYTALRGYPSTAGRGPIEVHFDRATPAIDGHIAAVKSGAYEDLETEHWAGGHYESWKWDFAGYITGTVATEFTLTDLGPTELDAFFEAFWGNADEYTDTDMLSTPVPQYLLGSWGVRQLPDYRTNCLEEPEQAASVLSNLFDEDEHLVTRMERFHDFAACERVSDGNLLRIATTFLMGAYPDEYVNFQYDRFNTFFLDCSNSGDLKQGYNARQYYQIVLACRDIQDVLQTEIEEASMLDVHTLIRLYQDFLNE